MERLLLLTCILVHHTHKTHSQINTRTHIFTETAGYVDEICGYIPWTLTNTSLFQEQFIFLLSGKCRMIRTASENGTERSQNQMNQAFGYRHPRMSTSIVWVTVARQPGNKSQKTIVPSLFWNFLLHYIHIPGHVGQKLCPWDSVPEVFHREGKNGLRRVFLFPL